MVAGLLRHCLAAGSQREKEAYAYSPIFATILLWILSFLGPVWLYPLSIWFQIIGFLILISPIQSKAYKNLNSENNTRLTASLFIIFLTSTLASQIAGSLTFEVISWPIFMADVRAWKTLWQILTFIYPIERIIIASAAAAIIGTPIYKVLKNRIA